MGNEHGEGEQSRSVPAGEKSKCKGPVACVAGTQGVRGGSWGPMTEMLSPDCPCSRKSLRA